MSLGGGGCMEKEVASQMELEIIETTEETMVRKINQKKKEERELFGLPRDLYLEQKEARRLLNELEG